MNAEPTTPLPASPPLSSSDLLCLTVRQPWAWLIVWAGKDIENRTWCTGQRGKIFIHAAKGMTKDEYIQGKFFARHIHPALMVPEMGALERGGIIGLVDLVDCVHRSRSPWFSGPWGMVLRNPIPMNFMPCKGALGFWRLHGHNAADEP